MCCDFAVLYFTAMAKSHASSRSVKDWVLWAQGEDFVDIVLKPEHGEAKLGATLL